MPRGHFPVKYIYLQTGPQNRKLQRKSINHSTILNDFKIKIDMTIIIQIKTTYILIYSVTVQNCNICTTLVNTATMDTPTSCQLKSRITELIESQAQLYMQLSDRASKLPVVSRRFMVQLISGKLRISFFSEYA